MNSDSSQYKAANDSIKKINFNISEIGRVSKQLRLQQKIKTQTEIIKHLQFCFR